MTYTEELGTVGARADSDITEARTAGTLAQSQLTVLQTEYDALAISNGGLQGICDDLTVANGKLALRVELLQSRLAAVKNPARPMPVGSSVWREGTETLQQAFDRRTANWGVAPEAVRLFDPDGRLDAWPNLGTVAVYVSFKGNPADVLAGVYDAQYRWLFAQTPKNLPFLAWCYWHEPLPDWSPAAWRHAFQHIANIADEYPTGRAMSRGPILQGWDANPKSGRNVADLVPPVRIDFVGFDAYPTPDQTTECYRLCADAAAAHFKAPWLLTETGLWEPDKWTPEQTAAWVTQSTQVARDLGAYTYIYFDSPVGGDFRLSTPVEWAAIAAEIGKP